MRAKLLCCAVLLAGLGPTGANAQVVYDWNVSPATAADWNVDEHWTGAFGNLVPVGDFDESARIGNGGTAEVSSAVPNVMNLTIDRGTVRVTNGGQLEVLQNLSTGAAGLLQLTGNGQVSVAGNARGSVHISGPNVQYSVGGNYTASGTTTVEITGDTHRPIEIAGAANLGGELRVDLGGVAPTFGKFWPLLKAAEVNGAFARIEAVSDSPLPRGLNLRTRLDGGDLSVGIDNTLILKIDRLTGRGVIENPIAGPVPIKGYSIDSSHGLLTPAGWNSLASSGIGGGGWDEANPQATHLSELNLTSSTSLAVGQSLDLGTLYVPGPQLPHEEDVRFEYLRLDGEVAEGIVEYSGPVNDLVLNVDPATGEAAISVLSPFFAGATIKGYSIDSPSGSLTPASWNSLQDSGLAGGGWEEANPMSEHLSELNLQSSSVLGTNTLIPLGNIFTPGGTQDLVFEYLTTGDDILLGTVQYGPVPEGPLTGRGDFNGDGVLDATDIDLLSDQVRAMTHDAAFDLNGDQLVNAEDRRVWVEDVRRTFFGDWNLDGQFGTGDLVHVFQAGEYEDNRVANSSWTTGDSNGDREFDTGDLITAFSAGGFEAGPRAAVQAVPEPSSLGLAVIAWGLLFGRIRQRRR